MRTRSLPWNCIISLDDSGSLFMICCHRLRFSLSNDKSCDSTFVSRGSVKAFAINKGVLVPFSNDQQRWHPDKCLASGNARIVGEAKEKFQEIQKAYSVLSDSNKRFLYDAGVYDNDDDNDENGMGDFIGEMLEMMSQTKPNENSQDSFQELQELFVEMFQDDLDAGFGGSIFHDCPWAQPTNGQDCWTSSGLHFANGRSKCGNKRGNSAVNLGKVNLEELEHGTSDFYFGLNDAAQPSQGKGGSNNKRRNGRKQKVSSNHDVSS